MRPQMGDVYDVPYVHGLIDRIDALLAENQRYREALEQIRDLRRDGPYRHPKQIARDALAAASSPPKEDAE